MQFTTYNPAIKGRVLASIVRAAREARDAMPSQETALTLQRAQQRHADWMKDNIKAVN